MAAAIMLFGIKVRTILMIFIGFALFLIFSQFTWPGSWRKYHAKRREKMNKFKKKNNKKSKKTHPIVFVLIILLLMIIAFFSGSMFGFDRAMQSAPFCQEEKCIPLDCSQIEIQNCPECMCKLCGNSVRIDIPTS